MAHYDSKNAYGDVIDRFWWKSSEAEVHKHTWSVVDTLEENQKNNQEKDLHHARLYGNENYAGLDPYSYNKVERGYQNSVRFNIIESCIDTLHADLVQNQPRPMFLTDGGNWEEQRRAEKLTTFCEGQFDQLDVHSEIGPKLALDALVFGTGAVKVFERDGKACVENVHIHELMVDDREAFYGKPRSIYHCRRISRDVAIAIWPEHKKLIKDTPEAVSASDSTPDAVTDLIEIREAWHLPSAKGAKDGRHVICLENLALLDDEWTRESFPFIFLKYKRRLHGFRGKGLAEILSGDQVAINALLEKIHKKLTLGPGNILFVSPGSQINPAHINNEEWAVIECTQPPQHFVPESIPSDLYAELDRLQNRAWTSAGINQLQAKSQIPAGLDGGSGKALRIYNDTKSKRFMDFFRSFEKAHIELAKQLVDLTRDIVENGEDDADVSILAPNMDDGTASMLNWSDVNIERDKYLMRVFPTSSLSTTPQGKIADLQELMKINPSFAEDAPRILNFPDLKAHASIAMAPREILRKNIEHILSSGEYMSPEPMDDLNLAMKLGTAYYHRARQSNAPEPKLAALRQYLSSAKHMIEMANKPPPMDAPPPPGPPGPPPQAI